MLDSNSQRIRPEDLKDPHLFRLNSVVNFLYEQLSAVQGGTGKFNFVGPMEFQEATLVQDTPPTNPYGILNKKVADSLYSAAVLAEQLTTGRFLNLPIGNLTGVTGSGGGAPGPPSASVSPWVVDAFAASYTFDISTGWNHEVTATGNITVNVPTGGTSGQMVNIRVIQDATGGRQITLAAGFKSNRPDPGSEEALTSCLIMGIFRDASTVLVYYIGDNIPA